MPCKEAAAYHESGHCVMGHLLKLGCTQLSMVPFSGEVQAWYAWERSPVHSGGWSLVLIAGPVAEELAWGSLDKDGATSDLTNVVNAYGTSGTAVVRDCATALLLKHWGAVEALAVQLVLRSEVPPREVAGIIEHGLAEDPDARPRGEPRMSVPAREGEKGDDEGACCAGSGSAAGRAGGGMAAWPKTGADDA